MKPCVFVHTNPRQYVGALVSSHSLVRNTRHADRFDVRILHTDDHPFIREQDGRHQLTNGRIQTWRYANLQSFTPLRFKVPELMGYEGRAVVLDPDIFAVGDIWELLSRDMEGKAILCRPLRAQSRESGELASSVMLLDCAKLRHWRCEEQFEQTFRGERDFKHWIKLKHEPPGTIGFFEDEWNDFDRLTPQTKLLHNTRRETQPWKTGLPVDFTPSPRIPRWKKPKTWLRPVERRLYARFGRYEPHPDPSQERLFFGLLRECLDLDVVTEEMLREEMRRNHLRRDALEVVGRTPPPV